MPVSVDATVIRETELAVLVEVDGEEVWIPDSQIDDDSEIYVGAGEGTEGVLVVNDWIAKQKGLW